MVSPEVLNVLPSLASAFCQKIMFGRPEISIGRLFVEIASLLSAIVVLSAIVLR